MLCSLTQHCIPKRRSFSVDNPRPAATSLHHWLGYGTGWHPAAEFAGSLGEPVLWSTGVSMMLSQCLYAPRLAPNGLECGVNLVSDKFL